MKEQSNRLPVPGRIAPDRPIEFRFNRKPYVGYDGDTLASALLANNVRVLGRSFKYHRPRGVVGCWSEEPNAILQVGTGATAIPTARATQVSLYEGLEAHTVKGWPNTNFDLLAFSDFIAPLLAAGFYYKTFMWTQWLWERYEKLIRKASGLGFCQSLPDPDSYDHVNAHCDVLVVGGGPAGLMAALAAGRSGARVILADEQSEPGGSLLATSAPIASQSAMQWVGGVLLELKAMPEVTVLKRSSVSGYYDHNFLTIVEELGDHLAPQKRQGARSRLWKVRARQVVLAQGAIERPMVFCNNDRPGVMLSSAVATYLNRYAVRPGARGVIFTNNDSAYQTAMDLHSKGVEVVALVDVRQTGTKEMKSALQQKGIEVLQRHVVFDVAGRKQVKAAEVAPLSASGDALESPSRSLACDFIAMSGGWNPTVHLHVQSGGKCTWDAINACFVPLPAYREKLSAGSSNGAFGLQPCLQQGLNAGLAAARRCGFTPSSFSPPVTEEQAALPLQPLWRVPSKADVDRCPKQFLDFQNDVTVSDIRLAVREGYDSVEHVKRYTALGFGTDQGKMGNISGAAVLADAVGKEVSKIGTTTFRQPYTPVTFGAIAGRERGEALFDPQRTTALHSWHEQQGAVFELVGQWLRPRFYPRGRESMSAAVQRECLAVRHGVGVMDASTLGKIEVSGSDAAEFLDRVYPVNCRKIPLGGCSYTIMLGEDGMVKDDGTISRLGDTSYYLTTTTGGAAAVLDWLEQWLQTEWPELRVYLNSVTEHWSTIAVAGPESRRLLEMLGTDIDFSHEAFPFMTLRNGTLATFPVRVFRISFSGELCFEVNVDSRHAREIQDALFRCGATFDLTPYGTEAMHVLRAEKGYVIVGQETDGTVIPHDLGLQWMIASDKDFIGKRSLLRSDCVRKDRKQLVGLRSLDGEYVPEGAQLACQPLGKKPIAIEGHVTSSYSSPTTGFPISLALLKRGRERRGEKLLALSLQSDPIRVQVVNPCFYDNDGKRQKS